MSHHLINFMSLQSGAERNCGTETQPHWRDGLTMMFHASLLTRLCVDSFLTAVYLINQMPLSIIGKLSPYQHLFNNEPNCEEFGILSCRCFPYLQDYSKIKFDNKSYLRVFFLYSPLYKGYRCLNPQTNRVYISRHVIVYKTIFPFANNNSFSIV